jgi:ketosteroid isomerase-like protein
MMRPYPLRRLIPFVLVVALVLGCSGSAYEPPVPTISAAEINELAATATTFNDRQREAWPDVEAVFSVYAEDGVFYDMSFGDYWIGPEQIAAGHSQMASFFPDLEANVESLFLATERAAYDSFWVNLWMGEKPPEAAWPAGLEVFGFDGDQVAVSELWYAADTLEGPLHTCGGCTVDLESLANRYIGLWSSQNKEEIAALYAEDAVIVDSLFGIKANGIDDIEQLIPVRFGPGEPVRSQDKLYGTLLSWGFMPPDSAAAAGDVTGVAFPFTWSAGEEATEVETLVLLYLGSIEAGTFEPHSENLIVKEEIFHNPDTLSGLAR